MAKDLITESLMEVKAIKKTIAETAKSILSEQIGKGVNKKIDRLFEDDEMCKEEEVDDEPINVDKLREDDEEEEMKEEAEEDLEEAKKSEEEEEKSEKEEEEEEEMKEEAKKSEKIELDLDDVADDKEMEDVPSEDELKEVYNKIMKEVEIVKLPKDVSDVEDDAKEVKDFTDVEAEAKKDFTVKESRILKKFLSIHKNTVKENHALRNVIKKLVSEMKEVNLFNKKLLLANKLMNENTLTNTERKRILASFDSAKSIPETEAVYRSYSDALGMSRNRVTESVGRKIGGIKSVIKENKSGDENKDETNRWLELADLSEK